MLDFSNNSTFCWF